MSTDKQICKGLNDLCADACQYCGGCERNEPCSHGAMMGAELCYWGDEDGYCPGEEPDYEDDGQPDEMQEWHDFDPDC